MKTDIELNKLIEQLKNLDSNIKYSKVFSRRKELRFELLGEFEALEYLSRIVDCYIGTL